MLLCLRCCVQAGHRQSWALRPETALITRLANLPACQSTYLIFLVKCFSLEQSSHQSTRGEGDTIRAHSLPESPEEGRMGPLIFGECCWSSSLHPAESTETSLALLSRHLDIYSPRVTCAAPAQLRPREKSRFPPSPHQAPSCSRGAGRES